MTSLFKTKKASPDPSSSLSLANANGPAVPMGSVSREHVILMPSFCSNSTRKFIITCQAPRHWISTATPPTTHTHTHTEQKNLCVLQKLKRKQTERDSHEKTQNKSLKLLPLRELWCSNANASFAWNWIKSVIVQASLSTVPRAGN